MTDDNPGDYIKPELMACCGAREIRDGDVVIVGTGFPTMSANIAKYTHAPNARMMQESGVYDAQPKRPALSVGDPCLNPGAAMIGGLLDVMGMFLQGGWVDVGLPLGQPGGQVRQHQHHRHRRLRQSQEPPSRQRRRQPDRLAGEEGDHHRPARHAPAGREGGLHHHPGLHRRRRAPGRSGGFRRTRAPRSSSPTRRSCASTRPPDEAYLATYHPDTSVDEVRREHPLGPQGGRRRA